MAGRVQTGPEETERRILRYCVDTFLMERYASPEDIPPSMRKRLMALLLYKDRCCRGPGADQGLPGNVLEILGLCLRDYCLGDDIGRALATCPGLGDEEREEWISTLLERTRKASTRPSGPDHETRTLLERMRGNSTRCYDPNEALRYLVSRHGFRRGYGTYAMLYDTDSRAESIFRNFEACMESMDVPPEEKLLFLLNLPRFRQLRSGDWIGRALEQFLSTEGVPDEQKVVAASLICDEEELDLVCKQCHLLCRIEDMDEAMLSVTKEEAERSLLRDLRDVFPEDAVPLGTLRAYSEHILSGDWPCIAFRTHHRMVARWLFEHIEVEAGTIGDLMIEILEGELDREWRAAGLAHKLSALDFVHSSPESLSPGERRRALEAGMRNRAGVVRALAFRYALLDADDRDIPVLLERCAGDTDKKVRGTPIKTVLARDLRHEARARLLGLVDASEYGLSPRQLSRLERVRREVGA